MKKRLIVFILVITILCVSVYVWYKDATSSVNEIDPSVSIFVIQQGEAMRDIAYRLEKEGFVRNSLAFFLLTKLSGTEKNIQAGDFRLSTSMSAREVLDELRHGTIDVWVTIPEGWRNEEIALKLAGELQIPESEFLEYAKEGYMFPDTYLFPQQATASSAATIMRSNFDDKVMQSLEEDIENNQYSLDEIVTIASLVEREAKHDEDRPLVASVILNRLAIDMVLNIDATLQYALGYQENEKDWWKKELTNDDKLIDSPYNTYKFSGLPPNPIANPGLASIQAVLNPADTEYLYYISAPDGTNYYATTLDEHNENVHTYLR